MGERSVEYLEDSDNRDQLLAEISTTMPDVVNSMVEDPQCAVLKLMQELVKTKRMIAIHEQTIHTHNRTLELKSSELRKRDETIERLKKSMQEVHEVVMGVSANVEGQLECIQETSQWTRRRVTRLRGLKRPRRSVGGETSARIETPGTPPLEFDSGYLVASSPRAKRVYQSATTSSVEPTMPALW